MNTGKFLFYVKSFNKMYNQAIQAEASAHQLTLLEADVLLFLYNNPQLDTAKDIASYRMLAKSGVSASVVSLIEHGLLTSLGDDNDRRVVHLKLTARSIPIAAALKEAQERFISHVNEGITPEEKKAFSDVLKKMADNLSVPPDEEDQ